MTEPLLLIPGLMCTGALFNPQIDTFAGSREVIVADHTRADDMREIALRILADAPDSFALAGLSMGVYLSFEIMSLAPGRVTRLALLDGKARLDTVQQTAARHQLIAMANEGNFLAITTDILLNRLIAPGNATDPELRDTIIQMATDTGEVKFRRQMAAILGRPDYLPRLTDIACPTLILTGELDVITPPECAVEVAAQIPHAVLDIVPGCGHLATLEEPAMVNAAMRDWLDKT